MPLTDIPTYSSGSPSCHREVVLQVGLCEDKGQDGHPSLPQFSDGLRDRPGIQAAVLQQRDHRVLVGACIPTATLLKHTLLTQGFMSTSKAVSLVAGDCKIVILHG